MKIKIGHCNVGSGKKECAVGEILSLLSFLSEPLPVSRTRRGKFQLLYCFDSSGSRKDLFYCRLLDSDSSESKNDSYYCRF